MAQATTNSPAAAAPANQPVGASIINPVVAPQIRNVYGSFYTSPYTVGNTTRFVPATSTAAFTETFPSIGFDPDQTTLTQALGCQPPSPLIVNQQTLPFADATPQDDGTCQVQYAQSSDISNPSSGARYKAGVDTSGSGGADMGEFQAVFTATLTVVTTGAVTLGAAADDSYILGIGPRLKDPDRAAQPPQPAGGPVVYNSTAATAPTSTTAMGYPVVAADLNTGVYTQQVTLNVLQPGVYPIEVDYIEGGAHNPGPGNTLEMVLAADAGTGSRVTGVRDCAPCDSTIMAADFANPINGQIARGAPFDTRTGNHFLTATDLTDAAPGRALLWARTYNSQAADDSSAGLGPGWTDPYATRLDAGPVITITSPEGNKLQFLDQGDGTFRPFPGVDDTLTRNADGTYTEYTWAQETVAFDASGRATDLTDAHGRALHLTYDGQHRLTQVTDVGNPGRYLSMSYNGGGQIAGVQDNVNGAPGSTVGYAYDGAGNLTTVTDVNGHPLTYAYGQTAPDGSPLLTAVTNQLGQVTEQTHYDALGRVDQQTAQNGTQVAVAYASHATTLTTTGSDGTTDTEQIFYDPTTDAITGTMRDGVMTAQYQFDANFDPVAVADGGGNTTYTTYDRLGLPLAITDTTGMTRSVTYDTALNPVTMTDSMGRLTTASYDGANDLLSQTTTGATGLSTTSSTSYGAALPVDMYSPDGVDTHYDYDPTTSDVLTKTVGYGTAAAQVTAYGYDSMGRVASTTVYSAGVTARTDLTRYNPDGTVAATVQNSVGGGAYDPARPDRNVTTTYGYDALGRQVAVTDTLGQVDATHYNAAGQVDWTAHNLVPAQFDTRGEPVSQAFSHAAPDQNVSTQYGYDGLGRQTLVTQTGVLTGTFDPSTRLFGAETVRVTRTDYDTLGQPVATTQNYQPGQPVNNPAAPDVNVMTTRQYDAAGNVITTTDPLGRVTVTGYDGDNRPVTTTVNDVTGDPRLGGSDTDIVGVTRYAPDGAVDRQIDNYVPGTSFSASQPITDRVTQYQYDALGRPTTTIATADPGESGSALNRATVTAYDPTTGRVVGRQDALGRWTATTYDALGRAVTTIHNCTDTTGAPVNPATGTCAAFDPAHPDRNVQTGTAYDPLGRAYQTIDPRGVVTGSGYDGLGRTTMTTQDAVAGAAPSADTNVATGTSYDGLGHAMATTDAAGATTRDGYDGLGRTVATTDTLGHVTLTGYDGTGAARWSRTPDGTYTVYALDGLGRVAQTTQDYAPTAPADRTDVNLTTGTRYDLAGRTVATIDPAGRVTTDTYDLRDHLIQQVRNAVPAGGTCMLSPCNVTTGATYDRAGDRIGSVDPLHNPTAYSYDAAGEQTATTDALGGTTVTVYDALGRTVAVTDQLGRKTTSRYDGLDDLIARTTGITAGSPGTAASLGATTVYTYDRGLLTDQQGPDGVDTHTAYDALGRALVTTVGYGTALARATGAGYDPDGRVVTTTTGLGTPLQRDDVTVYNPDGTAARAIQNYTGDGAVDPGRPDQNVATFYSYDALGRQIATRDALGRYTLTHYDGAGRADYILRDAAPVSDDANGNPLVPATPLAYDPAHPDQNVATLYAYDVVGNQTMVTQTGILTGSVRIVDRTPVFAAATTRTTRTGYNGLDQPITTTQNSQPGQPVNSPSAPDVNVQSMRQYDAAGNQTWQRDALGRWTQTRYDALNRPVTTTVNYEDGNPTTVASQDQGWTDGSDTDIVGVTRYRADGSTDSQIDNYVTGAFAASQPITDRVTAYGYDGQGRPITTTANLDPAPADAGRADLNRVSVTAYDPATGRVVGQRDALGRWTATTYDALGEPMATIRDCADNQGRPVDPATGSCGAVGPDRNLHTGTSYDALGRAIDTVGARGDDTHTAYDGLGRALATTQGYVAGAPARADTNVTTTAQYDALGRTVVTTDAVGAATTTGYNGLDQTVAVTDTLGHVTRTGYDGTGTERWRVTPDGRITIDQVDGLGRVIQATDNYTTTADAGAGMNLTTGTQYDLAGRVIATIDAAGRVISDTYDLRDQVIVQTQNYVPAGQPCLAPPCNVTTTARYDHAGDRVAGADPLGNATRSLYDAAGEVTATVDALGGVVSTAYDQGGRVVTETDQLGRQAVSAYDGVDDLVSQTTGITAGSPGTPPSPGATTVYTYNAGLLTDQRGPDGVDTHDGYDALGRAITTTLGAGTALARTSLTGYDAVGRAVTTTVGAGTPIQRSDVTVYNPNGTVNRTIKDYSGAGVYDPASPDRNVTTTYLYDAAGRPVLTLDALGHATLTRYDSAGRADYTLRNPASVSYGADGSPLAPATPPAFSPAQPDQNVATLYAYDALGHQTLVTATGILTGTFHPDTRTFDAATTRATRTDYDGLERPITTTLNWRPALPVGQLPDANVQSVHQYDLAGNTIGARDALNRWTVTGYDALNRPVTTTVNYEDGNPTTVAPQDQGWTDGSDTDLVNVTRYRADSSVGATIANVVTGTDGQPAPFTASQPITNQVTQYGYDGQGRPITTTANLDPNTPATPGAPGYRADLNRVGLTSYVGTSDVVAGQRDALGRWTAASYDALAQRSAVVRDCTDGGGTPVNPATGACAAFDPARPDQNVPTTYGYDALGRTSVVTDALGHATTTQYDGLDRALAVTRDAVSSAPASSDTNVTTRYQYDALGQTLATTNPVSGTTGYQYDALGRTTATTDTLGRPVADGQYGSGARWSVTPDGRYTVQHVDGLGRTIQTIQNYSPTALLTATDANLITATVYDAGGRVTQVTDPAGRVTQYGYDLRDHLTRVTRNVQSACAAAATDCNVTTTYRYDRAGRRVAATDARGATTSYQYDAAGEQTAALDALGRATQRAYDAGGRVIAQHDPRGAAYDLQYSYDRLDRVTQTAPASSSSGTLAPIATTYDALGQRTSLADGTGTTTYGYDGLGRTTVVSAPATGAVGYTYDAAGRRTQLIYPDGTALDYTYRADNHLQQVTQAGAPQAAPLLAAYSYDGAGRVTRLARGNGATTTYGYDGADRLLQARTTTPDGAQQSLYRRTVDVLGQTTVLTETTALTPLPNGGVPTGGGNGGMMSMGRAATAPAPASALGALADPWAAPLGGLAPLTAPSTGATISAPAASSAAHAAPAIPANPDIAPARTTGHTTTAPARPTVRTRTAGLGLRFEANRGQTTRTVYYLARGAGYTVYLTGTDATIAVTAHTAATRPHGDRRHPAGSGAHAAAAAASTVRTVLRLRPLGTRHGVAVVGLDRLPGGASYAHGTRTLRVPTYKRVLYRGVYPGVNLIYYGTDGRLEYDWRLAPHADVRRIRLAVEGAGTPRLARDGSLLLSTPEGVLRQARPVAFQTIQGRKRAVSVSYVLLGQGRIGFRLGHYDQRHGVVIDPVLQYSSYLGGSTTDVSTALAVDGQGNAYLAGYTLSPDFPDTTGTTPYSGTYDVFVTKVVSGTGAIAYSTYLGGSGNEQAGGIAVDGQGNAYVTGQTDSADYPTTVPTFQVSAMTVTAGVTSVVTTPLSVSIPPTGTDAFVTKLGPTGAISYSTRLGSLGGINALGDTWGRGIAVNKQGEAYVTGQTDSPDFPVTTLSPVGATDPSTLVHSVCNPLTGVLSQPLTQTVTTALTTTGGLCYDAFVTRLSADGQALLYSTYLGGGRDDMGDGIAADANGHAYVTGRTESPDFPVSGTVGGSLDNTSGGPLGGGYPACHETTCADAFAVKLDTTSGGLVPLGLPAAQAPALWLLGGPGGTGSGGLLGDVVMGTTGLLTLPLSGLLGATADAIVNGPSEVWGRYLGGSNADEGRGLALDPTAGASLSGGGVYLAGQTQSADFPTSTGAYSATFAGGTDGFVTKLLAATGAISYSTYLGGGGYDSADALAVDTSGHAYVTGQTYSADYPLIGSLQSFLGTSTSPITTSMAFVTKLNKQGTALWYSTYLGGSGGDAGAGVGVDPIGDVWATGPTGSVDFLTLRPQQPTLNNTPSGGNQSGAQDAFVSFIDNTTRHFTYGYDGLQRLVGVTETLGNAYAYAYDPVGNRTDVSVNGVQTLHDGYDAADEAITATTQLGTTQNSYDAAGNLTGDAATSYSYDALDRLTALTATAQQQTTTYGYNGDGTLVAQAANGTTTRYTQDVAANPDPGQPQDQQTPADLTPAVGATPDQSGADQASVNTAGDQSGASLATDQGTASADGISAPATDGAALSGSDLPVAPLLPAQPTTAGPVPTTGGVNAGLSQVLQETQQTNQGTSAPVDYLYGADRLASTSATNPQAHVWYVADLQGSVRYTQDDTGSSGQSLNYDPVSPRYDPYGTIDRGADGDGIVAQPFGYRGEVQDAATGLVDLRARMYNPASGQFLQRDPLEQQTGQAYAYAGDNPQTNADPTGRDFVEVRPPFVDPVTHQTFGNPVDAARIKQAIIDDFAAADPAHLSGGPVDLPVPNQSQQVYNTAQAHADIVSLYSLPLNGAVHGQVYNLVPDAAQYGGIQLLPNRGVDPALDPYIFANVASGSQDQTDVLSRLLGRLDNTVNRSYLCHVAERVSLEPGTQYPISANGALPGVYNTGASFEPQTPPDRYTEHYVVGAGGAQYVAFARYIGGETGERGLVGYSVCRYVPNGQHAPDETGPCHAPDAVGGATLTAADALNIVVTATDNVLYGGSVHEAVYGCLPGGNRTECSFGLAGIALNFVPLCDIPGARAVCNVGAKVLLPVARLAADPLSGVLAKTSGNAAVHVFVEDGAKTTVTTTTADKLKSLFKGAIETCDTPRCFPAGTLVATPSGHIAIEKLHVGDKVLAEDPKTGKVESEPVQALIVRPVSDLLALDLSDGSILKAQPNHLFWVDGGPGRRGAGWLKAGQLRPGDRLRTVNGKEITVVQVRQHVGHAVVYTLTVAHDHTFFVGTGQVLVHNSSITCPLVSVPTNGRNGYPFRGEIPALSSDHAVEDAIVQSEAERGVSAALLTQYYHDEAAKIFARQYASSYRAYGIGNIGGTFSLAADERLRLVTASDIFVRNVSTRNPLPPSELARLQQDIAASIRQAIPTSQRFSQAALGSADHAEDVLAASSIWSAEEHTRVIATSNFGGLCARCQTRLGQQLNGNGVLYITYHYGYSRK